MRHIHADVIIAWANGAKIQWRPDNNKGGESSWSDVGGTPYWEGGNQYRVKPKPMVKKWKYAHLWDGKLVISSLYYSSDEEFRIAKPGLCNFVRLPWTEQMFEGE